MRLVDPDRGISISFAENKTNVLVLESKRDFTDLISMLIEQEEGHEGSLVLSEGDKQLQIAKSAELLLTPFDRDFQNKKIINRLYQELSSIANEEMPVDLCEVNTAAVKLLDRLAEQSPYPITYNIETDITSILKLYAVGIDGGDGNLLEVLCDYMKIMARLCGVRLFIFVNLSTYLDEGELTGLYEMAAYEKMQILLLENSVRQWLDGEIVDIIDKDHCLIHL